MQIQYEEFTKEAAHRAGVTNVNYCRRSPRPRTRFLADFLVSAQALARGYALVTRDRGYYRIYFPGLVLIEP